MTTGYSATVLSVQTDQYALFAVVCSAKYDGTRLQRHLKTIMVSLNCIRRTGSQRRLHSTGVMWSNYLVPVTARAAEFNPQADFLVRNGWLEKTYGWIFG